MAISTEDIENWFTYHAPSEADQAAYMLLREKAKDLAKTIVNVTPPSDDQSDSIRKLREAVMTANSAIACGGK
jgi:hypothetical protein